MQPDGEQESPSAIEADAPEELQIADVPTGEDDGPISMAEALAQARAAEASEPADESVESGTPPESAPSEGDAPAAETPAPTGTRAKLYTEQAALQRALDLRAQGREAELDPAARGLLRKFEQQVVTRHKAEEAEEAEFREMWLAMEATRLEDPAAFQALMDEVHPEAGRRAKQAFYYSYRDAHPDISLENPNPGTGAKQRSEHEITAELVTTYGQGFEQTLDAIAEDAGLNPEAFKALKAEYQFGKHPDSGNLATFMAKVVTSVAEAMAAPIVEKEKAKIQKAEKAAFDLQLQRYKTLAQQTPRSMPAGVMDNRRRGTVQSDPSRPFSMKDALAAARESLVEAG